jgi:hypothetical protein
MESWVLGSAPTLRSPYDDLDLGRRLVLEPEHVAVAVLLRAVTLLIEVLPAHVYGEKPLAKSLRGYEGGPEAHEPLLAIALGRRVEGGLYLLACGERDAALFRQHQGRKGEAAGDGLQISCGQSLPVADEEASQVFIRWVITGSPPARSPRLILRPRYGDHTPYPLCNNGVEEAF